MKLSKILVYVSITISLLLPCFVPVAQAASTSNYVGVNEGQEIIWKTEFDEGPLEDWLEARYGEAYLATPHPTTPGLTRLDYYMEMYWDPLSYDDDVVAWRVTIIEIGKEKDLNYDGHTFNERDADYVKLKISIYETEDQSDPEAWDDIDKGDSYYLYDNEEDVYADFLYEGYFEEASPGFYYYSPNGNYQADYEAWWTYDVDPPMSRKWPMFFVPKGLDYGDVADEVDEKLEERTPALDDIYSVSTESVKYFFQNKDVGFDTTLEYDTAVPYTYVTRPEDFDSSVKYTDDGIMYFYEWSYDGETIAKFEIDSLGGTYVVENWWWMALIAAGVLVGLIVICIVIKSRK